MFGTLQDRLVKELAHAGLRDIETANRWIREVYLPRHNAPLSPSPRALPETAFVAADAELLSETLCIEGAARRGRDNTVAYEGLKLQLPESRMRAHYVKARVKVREYPDGSLAVLHGPRCLCRYDQAGREIAAPTRSSLRRVLDAVKAWPGNAGVCCTHSATASLDRVSTRGQDQPRVGTKKRASRSNKETELGAALL